MTGQIVAKISRIRARKDDWSSADAILVEGADEEFPIEIGAPFCLSGTLGPLAVGDSVQAVGKWGEHPKYGVEFKAGATLVKIGTELSDVEVFVGRICGPFRARMLTQKFGAELPALLSSGDRSRFGGLLAADETERVFAEFVRNQRLSESFAYLAALPLEPKDRAEILDTIGDDSAEAVARDPYLALCSRLDWDFKRADSLALGALQLSTTDPRRLRAGIREALRIATADGDTWVAFEDLVCERRSYVSGQILKHVGMSSDDLRAGIELARQADPCDFVIRAAPGSDPVNPPPNARVYPADLWFAECAIAKSLERLVGAPDIVPILYEAPTGVSADQLRAVHNAATLPVSILTGGPGTGKTHTIRAIVSVLRSTGRPFALAAPTGKAAQRITEAVGETATTIHRLLGYLPETGGFAHHAGRPLPHAAIVVDEASMIDVELFAALLDAVPSGSRVIIVGDPDQLPSVGPGQVLLDLLESRALPTVELSEIFRQASDNAIPHAARQVRDGALKQLPARSRDLIGAGFDCDPETTAQHLVKIVTDVLLRPSAATGRRAFAPHEIQVLCPQRHTDVGTIALNLALQKAINPLSIEDPPQPSVWISDNCRAFVGDPVIQRKNDYDLDIYNGDLGRVWWAGFEPPAGKLPKPCNWTGRGDKLKPILFVDFGARLIAFSKAQVRKLSLAYALTVHSSQGSQFPCVVMPWHVANASMLQRRLIYTGLTRATECYVAIGTLEAGFKGIASKRGLTRRTGLQERLASRDYVPAPTVPVASAEPIEEGSEEDEREAE